MASRQAPGKSWLVPIVLVIGAIMVLPAGMVVGGNASARAAATHTVGGPDSTTRTVAPAPIPTPLSTPTGAATNLLNRLGTSPLVSVAAKRPGSWLQSLIDPSVSNALRPLASYPNLYLLENPDPRDGSLVAPPYMSQPAPMGIADYGLGVTPYTYSPTHFLGTVSFVAPPNVTDPGAQSVIDPGSPHLGDVGSAYEFGIQLNTVMTNVSISGSNDGAFWTQNVLDVNDSGIHFLQDVFNLSAGSNFYIPPGNGTVLSGCGTTDLVPMLTVYGGVFQCVGSTIPISPSDYPLTIELYNNATVTATNDSELNFGIEILGGHSVLASGTLDTLVFNNPNASFEAPPNPVGFTVSGTTPSPTRLLDDSELDLVGSIGGDNAVFHALNGSLALEYSNATSGGFRSIPSAYNFGGDTGETSTGIAGYWSGTTESIHQGPSFLYGLWGAMPYISVPSGSIQFEGRINPTYGFVFVSNVALSASSDNANLSWVPTTSTGRFDTYLPPSIPPSTQYYVAAFAPEYQEIDNGTAFNTSQVPYPTISLYRSTGTLNSPLYMKGDLQASTLSHSVSGVSSPVTFSDLALNLSYPFDHLNDYGFPTFVIFSATNVTSPLVVNNVTEANDSRLGNFYIWDFPATSSFGFLSPGPELVNTTSLQDYSGQLQIFDCTSATITNESFLGSTFFHSYQGGSVFLWQDSHAIVREITVTAGPYGADYAGVFVGDSESASVSGVSVSGGSNGIDDVGSFGTSVRFVNASVPGTFGVYALSSTLGSYSELNATTGATAVYAGGDYGGGGYYAVPGITSTSIDLVSASMGSDVAPSVGVEIFYSEYVKAKDLQGNGFGFALIALLSNFTDTSNVSVNNPAGTFGAVLESDLVGTVSDVTVAGESPGVLLYGDGLFTGENTSTSGPTTFLVDSCFGILLENGSDAQVIDEVGVGTASLYGIVLDEFDSSAIDATTATDGAVGVYITLSAGDVVNGVSASGGSIGVELYADVFEPTVSSVIATGESVGIYANQFVDSATFSQVTTSDLSIGVWLIYSEFDSISGVSATNLSLGGPAGYSPFVDYLGVGGAPVSAVYTEFDSNVAISNVTATNYPFGLTDDGSGDCPDYPSICSTPSPGGIEVQGVNLTNGTTAVTLYDTMNSTFSDISAFGDSIGFYALDDSNIVVTGSSFVGCELYAVYLDVGSQNDVVWDNDFIGNNGATSNYSAAHIQAYDAGFDDQWDLCAPGGACTGNYWADWHTYTPNGTLAPYLIAGNNWDYYPIGAPVGEYSVTFSESGLPSGTSWSVTFNGVTRTSSAPRIMFYATSGSYPFSVGALTGYLVTPTQGTITTTPGGSTANILFQPIYTVTLNESGLASGTPWTAVFGGVERTSATTSITFSVTAGTYAFQVPSVTGYTVSPSSGSVTVSGGYTLLVTFTAVPPTTYAVTLSEGGLPTGAVWSATVGGATQSTSGTSLVYDLSNGVYSYSFNPVSGFTLGAGSTGSVTVSGAPVSLAATYFPPPTYLVTLSETGLAVGTTWSATLNGVTESTSGSSIGFSLPNGTYSYSYAAVAGYELRSGSTGTAVVSGSPVTESATYSAIPVPPRTYEISLSAGGLPAGTVWSATVNGTTQSTGGSTLVFYLPNGTYSYSFTAVSGYTLSSASSGNVTVSGAPTSLSATYKAASTAATASTSALESYFSIALVIALIALVIALVALLMGRGGRAAATSPPEEWSGESPPSEPGPAGGSGGEGANWSEDAGSETPPSG